MPDARQRAARLRQLIDISGATAIKWEVGLRPFARPADDVATILTAIRVETNGVAQKPDTRHFWDRAFDGIDLPDDPERDLRDDDPELIDAAWIVERTMVEDLTSVGAACRNSSLANVCRRLSAIGTFPTSWWRSGHWRTIAH